MATTKDYIDFVIERLKSVCAGYDFTYKKMFGEYMIYLDARPVITVCDNTCFVKINGKTASFLSEKGFPYEGAKEHFILDIEDEALLTSVVGVL